MTLTAAGPAGTVTDPFAGTGPADDGAELSFPADRYSAVGATEQDVADLTAYFDSLTRTEQRDALAWHDERSDEQLAESLATFRQARDAFTGLGGLTAEQLAELAALSDDERAQLAELSGAEQPDADEQAAYDALSDDEKAALAALTPEQLAELRPEPADAGAEPVADASAAPAGTSDAEQPDSGAQTGDETSFSTKQIADLTIEEVDALIASGTITAEQALTAELARGDKARKTLVDKLTAATTG